MLLTAFLETLKQAGPQISCTIARFRFRSTISKETIRPARSVSGLASLKAGLALYKALFSHAELSVPAIFIQMNFGCVVIFIEVSIFITREVLKLILVGAPIAIFILSIFHFNQFLRVISTILSQILLTSSSSSSNSPAISSIEASVLRKASDFKVSNPIRKRPQSIFTLYIIKY